MAQSQRQGEFWKQQENDFSHTMGHSLGWADFSSETLQVRSEWNDIFEMLKEKKNLSRKNTISGKSLFYFILFFIGA